jgi:ABC-type nitrate/sulfonate/bicarbonate transport system substrate-binding protein
VSKRSPRSPFPIFFIVLGVFLCLLQFACHKGSLSRVFRIGYLRNDLGQFPIQALRHNDLFTQLGFSAVEWSVFDSNDQLLRALGESRCDAGVGDFLVILRAAINGGLKILCPVSLNGYSLIVRRDEGGIEPGELKGKRIGFLVNRSIGACLLHRLLADESDGAFQEIIVSSEDAAGQLVSGQVDALFLPEPLAGELLQDDRLLLYLLSEKIWADHPHSVLFISTRVIQERPDVVEPLLRVFFENSDWMQRNKDSLLALSRNSLNLNAEILKSSFNRFRFTSKVAFLEPEVYLQFLERAEPRQGTVHRTTGECFAVNEFFTALKSYLAQKEEFYNSLPKNR